PSSSPPSRRRRGPTRRSPAGGCATAARTPRSTSRLAAWSSGCRAAARNGSAWSARR
ncbi:MAG: hypothetical protein AVDCRST_MAG35-16, partial [uncultured Quadrisphaera sp.]